ncbi:Choline transporter-like protein ctl1 [Coniochaeta hoffmannii]|uniref:Protein PNS1 n=1 Tax=Coniochaeta hoffmannii TaxID=91930 RepID=A0AA38S112_9PEZI|nr:Choline transporter-like protein ctl1 [Coniochaeta hoffmannii]
MVDVGLESQMEDDDDPPADLTMEAATGDSVPAFQKFRSTAGPSRFALRRDGTQDPISDHGPPPSSVGTELNLTPAAPSAPDTEIFKHDPFFAWIYLIAIASMLATFVLVYLHTSTPSAKLPLGDTIYTILQSSFHLLAVDTMVAIVVSLVWLAALRSFVRPLVALIFIAVPVVLFSFCLYPFISSYKDDSGGKTFQDVAMRWAAVIPGAGAILWLYLAYNGRHSIRSAIEILDFSSRILGANSALILVGMGSLAAVVLWTWAWLAMFTRVFLGGYFAGSRFIINASTWWLGIYFVLMYIWTISVISGVQRGTTAATVSQWYFHRNVVPAPSSTEIVSAAFNHSVTTIFGSISLSTLLALVVRLPLLILPGRLAGLISMCAYSLIPTPIAALTNPLTLTYAAIHSNTLAMAARGLSTMDFLSPNAPTTTLTPRTFSNRRLAHSPLLPYRLAKLILHATRFIMATGLGFAGWVITARQLQIKLPDGIGVRGSAYAYVVGLVASFIGWGILGAMEGILSGIVDAVVICYGSEKRMVTGGGGYCMEAATLFGGSRDEMDGDEIY